MSEKNPKVFISYSHDNSNHIDRVWELSNKLRSIGIDCILDQYEESPEEGWPRWMENNIRSAEFVIMICTKIYNNRIMGLEEEGKGHGVIWEGNLIYQSIYNSGTKNNKFIPVLFEDGKKDYIPTPLQGSTFYSVYSDFEKLYKRLRGISKNKPELGKLLNVLPEKERKTVFTALHIDSANTLFCKYLVPKNRMYGHISILFYGLKIANISDSPFTVKDVKIEYTFKGQNYSDISNVILTSSIYLEHKNEHTDCIAINSKGQNIILMGWKNLRNVIGEYNLIPPGGILAGSALFILQIKNIEEVKEITNLRILITDYSNNESTHSFEIKDAWIDMGRSSSINPRPFKSNGKGGITYI